MIDVAASEMMSVAATPPKSTVTGPPRFWPVIVTGSGLFVPLDGLTALTYGRAELSTVRVNGWLVASDDASTATRVSG